MKASLAYPAAASTFGFDIYHGDDDHGDVQFGAAVGDNPSRQFCWAKASQGDFYQDSHFDDHWQRMLVRMAFGNFLGGSYHWLDPWVKAKAQFDFYMSIAGKSTKRGCLRMMLDVEPTVKLGVSHSPDPDLVMDFAVLVKAETGMYPTFYFGSAEYGSKYKSTFSPGLYVLNLARYATSDAAPTADPDVLKPPYPCDFHQYTGTGRIRGNSPQQNFDLDVFDGTFAQLKAKHTYK